MTVCDVLKKAEPSQKIKIGDAMRGIVEGTALSLYDMLDGMIKNLDVEIIRAEGGVIVVEVKSE